MKTYDIVFKDGSHKTVTVDSNVTMESSPLEVDTLVSVTFYLNNTNPIAKQDYFNTIVLREEIAVYTNVVSIVMDTPALVEVGVLSES
jgi:hypothetical protein